MERNIIGEFYPNGYPSWNAESSDGKVFDGRYERYSHTEKGKLIFKAFFINGVVQASSVVIHDDIYLILEEQKKYEQLIERRKRSSRS